VMGSFVHPDFGCAALRLIHAVTERDGPYRILRVDCNHKLSVWYLEAKRRRVWSFGGGTDPQMEMPEVTCMPGWRSLLMEWLFHTLDHFL